jgi:hypothetical protein
MMSNIDKLIEAAVTKGFEAGIESNKEIVELLKATNKKLRFDYDNVLADAKCVVEENEKLRAELAEYREMKPVAYIITEGIATTGVLSRTRPSEDDCREYELSLQPLFTHPTKEQGK